MSWIFSSSVEVIGVSIELSIGKRKMSVLSSDWRKSILSPGFSSTEKR